MGASQKNCQMATPAERVERRQCWNRELGYSVVLPHVALVGQWLADVWLEDAPLYYATLVVLFIVRLSLLCKANVEAASPRQKSQTGHAAIVLLSAAFEYCFFTLFLSSSPAIAYMKGRTSNSNTELVAGGLMFALVKFLFVHDAMD
jgi:hypothetical protein